MHVATVPAHYNILCPLHLKLLLFLNLFLGGARLRIDDDIQGLGPPLCEDSSVADSGIFPGCRVVLEPGAVPTSNQVKLSYFFPVL